MFNLLRKSSGNYFLESKIPFVESACHLSYVYKKTPNVRKMKGPKLVDIGSVLFSVVCIVQGVFLCIYPTKYLNGGWVFIFLLFFIAASFMAFYLRFHKRLRHRCQPWFDRYIPKGARDLDIKTWLWLIWLVYCIGLVVTIAVIFNGVIQEHHKKTHCNKMITGTLENVTMCQAKDNEMFYKDGTICGSLSNETFCFKAKSKLNGLFKTDEFLGPNVLKVTLCATPVLMLLLLKSARAPTRRDKKPKESSNATGENIEPKQSKDHEGEPEDPVEDDDLKELYFRATLNLFDGMEMLEELLEYGIHENDVPLELETVILVFVCLFYILSFLELRHLAFRYEDDKVKKRNGDDDNDEKHEKNRKEKWRRSHVVNTLFQIVLNISFFTLRMVMWLGYRRDAAIFLAKNLISIVLNVMPYLIACGCVDDKSDDEFELENSPVVPDVDGLHDGDLDDDDIDDDIMETYNSLVNDNINSNVGDHGGLVNSGLDDREVGVDVGNDEDDELEQR